MNPSELSAIFCRAVSECQQLNVVGKAYWGYHIYRGIAFFQQVCYVENENNRRKRRSLRHSPYYRERRTLYPIHYQRRGSFAHEIVYPASKPFRYPAHAKYVL
jgi:hypothetical protein